MQSLNTHPKSGASWEGFLLEEVIDRLRLEDEHVHFWATHTGAELDLLIVRGQKRIGIEIKRTTAPKVTPSIRSALRDLGLSEVIVVHAGGESGRLGANVRGGGGVPPRRGPRSVGAATVKRYRSEKAVGEDGWRHVRIVLGPLNPDFEPIELAAEADFGWSSASTMHMV